MGNCQSVENEQGYLREQQQNQEKQLLQNKAVDAQLSELQTKIATFDGMSRELKMLKKKVVLIEAEKANLAEQLSKLSGSEAKEAAPKKKSSFSCASADCCPFGQSQSPIDICLNADDGSVRLMTEKDYASTPLEFNYPQKVDGCTILNNGYTVQINIDAENNKCLVSIHGKTYSLKQFHFHTPAEHTLEGEKYEMEMHLVHTNEAGEICVLGYIFAVQQKYQRTTYELSKMRATLQGQDGQLRELAVDSLEDDEHVVAAKGLMDGNDFLAQFWDQLPRTKTEEDIPLKNPLCFDHLFEAQCRKIEQDEQGKAAKLDMEIYQYQGSLTTPPYSEGVQWLLCKKTLFMNNKQLRKLSACWDNRDNSRPVQEYFGRTVKVRNQSVMKC